MALPAERLALQIGFSGSYKGPELKKRIWFTVGALIVFHLGSHIPVPGIDPAILDDLLARQSGSLLDMYDMMAGGAFSRMSIFALGFMPYFVAAFIMRLLTAVSPHFKTLMAQGRAGRRKVTQYVRYGTVLLAALQGYGIALGLEGWQGAVVDPGMFFRVSTVATLVAGTLFLMWLDEQITTRGVGNGISLIIMAGIVAELPRALVRTLDMGLGGSLPAFVILALIVGSVAITALIVFIERAQRRVLVQYPERQVGGRVFGGESSHLPLKINTSGVIPPIFASAFLLLPLTVASFPQRAGAPEWLTYVTAFLGRGEPRYLLLYAALILFFAFYYATVVFNPTETAGNLQKYGGYVPGIRPGRNTAEHLDFVLTRLTVVGAIYLTAVCILPEMLISQYAVPFHLGGTGLLIVVTVTMDTAAQIQSHLVAAGLHLDRD